MVTEKIELIRISPAHLLDSPTQPRVTYNEASLQELAESIRSQGLLQPIVVRKRGLNNELVFGHRRTRAARLAGLEVLPAIVRNMTDAEVATAQIHENLEREDVSAIEEAEAFQKLMRDFGATAKQLMADTGKSKAYIYGRLKLLNAQPDVRAAMAEGLPTDVAIKIARLPTPAIQAKALDQVRIRQWVEGELRPTGWMSARDGLDVLEDHDFFIPIAEAKFDAEDATLHPEGRVCSTCPHNSRNDPEASGAFSADTCTDVPCFEARTEAAKQQLIEQHRAAGTLLEGDAAKVANSSRYAPYWLQREGVLGMSDQIAEDRTQTVRAVIDRVIAAGGQAPQLHLLTYGHLTDLVLMRAELPALWAAAGLPNPWEQRSAEQAGRSEATAGTGGDDDEDGDQGVEQAPLPLPYTAEEEAVRADWDEIKAAIMKAAAGRPRTTEDLRVIAAATIEVSDVISFDVVEAMGWTAEFDSEKDGYTSGDLVMAKLPQLTADQLGLLILLMAIDYGGTGFGRELFAARVAMARMYGVNPLDPSAPAAPAPTPSPAARAVEGSAGVKYRNAATGETWSGRGLQPRWLKQAIANGAKLSDFALQADLLAGAAGESSSTTPADAGATGDEAGV